jgi:integrase
MEKVKAPFCIFKRKDKPCFYVRFKHKKTGKYLLPKSTGQTNKTAAITTAWDWYTNGIPQDNDRLKVTNAELIDTVKTTFKKAEVKSMIEFWQKQGLLKTAVLTGEKSDRDFIEFLLEFWDYDRSPYIKEKLRRSHSIHKTYCLAQISRVKHFWQPFFAGRLLGTITRQDIDNFIRQFDNVLDKSARTKNNIIQVGTIALRWTYQKGLIDSDITQGITYFSGKPAERHILTPEQATALFAIEWSDDVAKLANLLACLTGMRAGEILGLRWQDLGENCIYIRHSWNNSEGLKTTKTNETRIVQVPFPQILNTLRDRAQSNPHGQGLSGFVFYSDALPNRPFDIKVLLKKFRVALHNIGMSETDSQKYTFHGWRHFYTAYMKNKIDDKLLQSQTGHKTKTMLEHYSNHILVGDIERIRQAQIQTFSGLLPDKITINKVERERDTRGHFLAYNTKAA